MKEMLVIHDEDARGNRIHTSRLVNEEDSLTVEALIRLRVESEVKRFNTQRPLCFFSLVQPEGVDITPRGYRLKEHRDIDSAAQSTIAVAAFEKKSYIINANGRDFQSLDEVIELKDDTEISFIKFMEIIGG